MVGGNDIKALFIYSIDEVFPVNSVINISEIKDGTVLMHSFGIVLFFRLGADYCD